VVAWESSKICLTGWLVSSAMRPSTVSAMCRGSFAWTSMSAALPARRRAAFFDSLLHSSLWL